MHTEMNKEKIDMAPKLECDAKAQGYVACKRCVNWTLCKRQ